MILLLSYHNIYLKFFYEEYCNNVKNYNKQTSLSKLLKTPISSFINKSLILLK